MFIKNKELDVIKMDGLMGNMFKLLHKFDYHNYIVLNQVMLFIKMDYMINVSSPLKYFDTVSNRIFGSILYIK